MGVSCGPPADQCRGCRRDWRDRVELGGGFPGPGVGGGHVRSCPWRGGAVARGGGVALAGSRAALGPGASRERLRFVATPEDAVDDADFVQETGPERVEV